jgi:hypothetical protein
MYLKTAFGICFLVIYITFLGEALCKKVVVQQLQDGQTKRMAYLGKRRIQYKRDLPGAPTFPSIPIGGLHQLNKRQTVALPAVPLALPVQTPPIAVPQLSTVGAPPAGPATLPAGSVPAGPAPVGSAPAPVPAADPNSGVTPSPPPSNEEDEEEEEEN